MARRSLKFPNGFYVTERPTKQGTVGFLKQKLLRVNDEAESMPGK